ncbi:hypothetical protein [Citrobacter portucalensis]|uniref:hypothetical protein n=1 Tax=Citrobacter portucalensis TaxID=1639133 RepID=UPI00226B0344|nr:hypothetical protein [Citrobacter portucalensis]MCX9068975.1 hypothetical protein [Citrobacter portucalensis]
MHQPYLDTDKKYKNTRYLHADLFEQQMIKIILENMNSLDDKAGEALSAIRP